MKTEVLGSLSLSEMFKTACCWGSGVCVVIISSKVAALQEAGTRKSSINSRARASRAPNSIEGYREVSLDHIGFLGVLGPVYQVPLWNGAWHFLLAFQERCKYR